MNFNEAIKLKEQYEYLLNSYSIKSCEWVITNLLVLPKEENSLLVYAGHLNLRGYKDWLINGLTATIFIKQVGMCSLIS